MSINNIRTLSRLLLGGSVANVVVGTSIDDWEYNARSADCRFRLGPCGRSRGRRRGLPCN